MPNTSVGLHVLYFRDAKNLYGEGLSHATQASAGMDLRACWDASLGENISILAGERYLVPSGIAIEIQGNGIAGFVYSRSGLGAKKGLTVSQGVGVIDSDYRGEVLVSLLNTSSETRTISRGERIAQLVLQPYFHAEVLAVDALGDTMRGSGGFGHTGK